MAGVRNFARYREYERAADGTELGAGPIRRTAAGV
jgi:hypothetical protein